RACITDESVYLKRVWPGSNHLFKICSSLRCATLIRTLWHIKLYDNSRSVGIRKELLSQKWCQHKTSGHKQYTKCNQTSRKARYQPTEKTGQSDQPISCSVASRFKKTGCKHGYGRN